MATRTPTESESGGQPSGIMPQLPLRELGLEYVPAIPVDVGGMADTLSKLVARVKQREQSLQGLSRTFTIGGSTARAYNFLFGSGASDAKAAEAHEELRALRARRAGRPRRRNPAAAAGRRAKRGLGSAGMEVDPFMVRIPGARQEYPLGGAPLHG
jgi:hypothetical protein